MKVWTLSWRISQHERRLAWTATALWTAFFAFPVVIGGLLTLPTITQEVFPELSLDVVTVTVEYPGASPEDVEEGIALRIE